MAPTGETPHWQFSIGGKLSDLPLHLVFCASDSSAGAAGAAGRGCAAWLSHRCWANGSTMAGWSRCLQRIHSRNLWLYAAYAQRRHPSAALRALLDFLEQQMRPTVPSVPHAVSPRLH